MYRFALVLPVFLLLFFSPSVVAQQQSATPGAQKTPSYAAIPADIAKQPNPEKATSDSLARGKKWWTIDCAMCHGKNGDGKGDTAKDMKLTIGDFTDPATLKDRTDGELFYIIKNGHEDMPPEGPRVKNDELWDLVNYVRSFSKKKTETEPPAAQPADQKPQ
ncbi:MAG TPA: cytochrome c [Verrucomicrobiae bacterium]|nr:cytochrome c [Verrucomicrobiae bacterium]